MLSGDELFPGIAAAMRAARALPDGTMPPYGLGWRVETLGLCGATEGHSGSTMGFQSDLILREGGELIVVLVNDFLSEAQTIAEAACDAINGWRTGRGLAE